MVPFGIKMMPNIFLLFLFQWAIFITTSANGPAEDWSVGELQEELMKLRQEFEKQSQHLATLTEGHESLKKFAEMNLVPIGFIYTELPGQAPPHMIWPGMTWTDVSFEYAGNFFRVLGGNSGSFGSVQGQNCPRIDTVESVSGGPGWYINVPGEGWSELVLSGDISGNQDIGIRFHIEANENRPVNQAVRLWRRTA